LRILLLLVLLTLGCADSAPPESDLPIAKIRVGNHEISVEVAADRETRNRGLMFRQSMPEDHGMLFVFPSERRLGFWMKNTPLPLTIAYADRTGRIVRIADLTPHDERPVSSVEPALYALEMNRDWFKKHGVIVGHQLRQLPKVKAR